MARRLPLLDGPMSLITSGGNTYNFIIICAFFVWTMSYWDYHQGSQISVEGST